MVENQPNYTPFNPHEKKFDWIICTDRDVESVRKNLAFESPEEFLSWIKDKRVLNMGAGMLKLEKDILSSYVDKVGNLQMVAMEPKLSRKHHRERHTALPENQHISSVAAVWDIKLALPFADGSFDRILSTWAFPYYVKNSETLKNVLSEIDRITTPGCEVRLSPVSREFFDFDTIIGGTNLKYKFVRAHESRVDVLVLYK